MQRSAVQRIQEIVVQLESLGSFWVPQHELELHARLEDRWSHIGEALDRFGDEPAAGRLRDEMNRRKAELHERLDGVRNRRLDRFEAFRARLGDTGHAGTHRIRGIEGRWEHPSSGRLSIRDEEVEYEGAAESDELEQLRQEVRMLRTQVKELRAKLGRTR